MYSLRILGRFFVLFFRGRFAEMERPDERLVYADNLPASPASAIGPTNATFSDVPKRHGSSSIGSYASCRTQTTHTRGTAPGWGEGPVLMPTGPTYGKAGALSSSQS